MLSDPERVSSIRSIGDDLLDISVPDPAQCQTLAERLRDTGDWLECVAGISSVVVQFDAARTDISAARERLESSLVSPAKTGAATDQLIEIPVSYGGVYGPDFESLCEQLALSRSELIALHTGREYRVDMLGFTPGFAYIGGLDDALNVPRLPQPRLHVAAGSIGIADGRTGVYALAGPGGWPIIGRTALLLFEPSSEQPFLLRAGTRIRFNATE